MASFGGIGVGLAGIRCFYELPPSPSETAVKFSREGGTGWDASEATRLVRAAVRTTPTMRMAPSCSNFPYPAPITASKREEKAVTSGRADRDLAPS